MKAHGEYVASLRRTFAVYRAARFSGKDEMFESRPSGGPVVFAPGHEDANILVPPCATEAQRQRIIDSIPKPARHRHFRSLQSSQALAQSVFATVHAFNLLSKLSDIAAEGGMPAFGPVSTGSTAQLEKTVTSLGEKEKRQTSVDVWINAETCVAVECKLSEPDFGTCSRPRLKSSDSLHCDGTYSHQMNRKYRCSLTDIGVRYWEHAHDLFGWSKEVDHRPCPMRLNYQLVRNVLAVSVEEGGTLNTRRGHALVVYDRRNPTMAAGDTGDGQWR